MPWILSARAGEYRSETAALEAARKMPELAGATETREPSTHTTTFVLGGDLMATVYPVPSPGAPGNTATTAPDNDEPVCEHCAGEVLPGNRFCCDACEDDHATMLAFMGMDDAASTYTLDGMLVRLADFFNDNPDLPQDERDAILALEAGDELVLGAGVGAAFLLRRVS